MSVILCCGRECCGRDGGHPPTSCDTKRRFCVGRGGWHAPPPSVTQPLALVLPARPSQQKLDSVTYVMPEALVWCNLHRLSGVWAQDKGVGAQGSNSKKLGPWSRNNKGDMCTHTSSFVFETFMMAVSILHLTQHGYEKQSAPFICF